MANVDNKIEEYIPLLEASRIIPGRPHISTLYRWWTRGVNGVKLETVLIGGRRMCSRKSLAQFVAAVTAAADGRVPATSSSDSRIRAINRATAELDDRGA